MTTNSTPWSTRTRQIASAWSSSSSGDIGHEAVAHRPESVAGDIVERVFPLGEDRVVAILFGQFQPEIETGASEHVDERGECRLATPRFVRRQRRLGDADQIGKLVVLERSSRPRADRNNEPASRSCSSHPHP